MNEALSWYRSALHTCLDGEGISGGTALKQFLALSGQQGITSRDKELCARVVRRSWEVLALPGEPELTNVAAAIEAIRDGEARPPRKGDSRS